MRKDNPVLISVVIPAYNEEDIICESINMIEKYFIARELSYEIIVVDDGSSDSTAKLIQEIGSSRVKLIKNMDNRGKGFSVKRGVLFAGGRYILYSDADLSVPVEEIEKFIFRLEEGFDLAIGSRRVPGSIIKGNSPWLRTLCRFLLSIIVKTVLHDIKDTQCGFKCFKKGVALSIFPKQKIDGYSFDIELLYIAQRSGFRIKEIPVTWIPYFHTKVNVFRDGFITLKDILKIKTNPGRYE